jgi:mRNA interferase RelE/StbE
MARITVQWTTTAVAALEKLPPKVRRGLLDKANELLDVEDPRLVHKPLTGPLQGYYRIPYSRFRAIYRVDEKKLPRGKIETTITVTFVAAGVRRQGDKQDVYRLAEKLVRLGIVRLGD